MDYFNSKRKIKWKSIWAVHFIFLRLMLNCIWLLSFVHATWKIHARSWHAFVHFFLTTSETCFIPIIKNWKYYTHTHTQKQRRKKIRCKLISLIVQEIDITNLDDDCHVVSIEFGSWAVRCRIIAELLNKIYSRLLNFILSHR